MEPGAPVLDHRGLVAAPMKYPPGFRVISHLCSKTKDWEHGKAEECPKCQPRLLDKKQINHMRLSDRGGS